MMTDAAPIGLLDACVLVGVIRREFLFAAARDGFYRPRWSDRIEGEWRSALLRIEGSGAAATIDGEIALAHVSFPDALVSGWEELEGPLELPDWHDRHVLAAAIKSGASLLVTDNLKDFPRRALAQHGIAPISSDEHLRAWAEARPEAARKLFADHAEAAFGDPKEARACLKRARLPRFAKEIERLLSV